MIEFPEIKNPEHAIAHYVEERILKKGLILPNAVTSSNAPQYDAWFEELDSFDLKELLESKKSLLNLFYKKYQQNVPSVGVVISSKNFLKFCHDVNIVPNLLSNSECIRVQYNVTHRCLKQVNEEATKKKPKII